MGEQSSSASLARTPARHLVALPERKATVVFQTEFFESWAQLPMVDGWS
jgi:hypothetical protein